MEEYQGVLMFVVIILCGVDTATPYCAKVRVVGTHGGSRDGVYRVTDSECSERHAFVHAEHSGLYLYQEQGYWILSAGFCDGTGVVDGYARVFSLATNPEEVTGIWKERIFHYWTRAGIQVSCHQTETDYRSDVSQGKVIAISAGCCLIFFIIIPFIIHRIYKSRRRNSNTDASPLVTEDEISFPGNNLPTLHSPAAAHHTTLGSGPPAPPSYTEAIQQTDTAPGIQPPAYEDIQHM